MDLDNFYLNKTQESLAFDNDCLISKTTKVPIIKSIPRFVDDKNYAISFGKQWNTFQQTQLDSFTGSPISLNRLETALQTSIQDLNGIKVLEAGSGAGRFTEILARSNSEIYTFDISNAIEANWKNNNKFNNLTFFQANIEDIPFKDNFFDLIICLGVIQHTPSSEKTIKELHRVVKPNGRIVFDHYKKHIGHYFSLYIPIWHIIKRLPKDLQLKTTNFLTKIFFPIHWAFRNSNLMQFLLRRISPISFYYGQFDLSKEMHFEFSKLDTHDKNTDVYKHHLSEKDLVLILKSIGITKFEISHRGNGLECIVIK